MLLMLVVVWGGVVLGGLVWLVDYHTRPGDLGVPPARWPRSSALKRSANHPALVVFLHPRCPCSRATLSNLRTVVRETERAAGTTVVFTGPSAEDCRSPRWPLLEAAKSIPGVTIHIDHDRSEASRFGARTSGIAMLFDRAGTLQFVGGLTAARAHFGPARGMNDVKAIAQGQTCAFSSASVYGCPLQTR